MKKRKKLLYVFCATLVLVSMFCMAAYAAPTGDVAGAIEKTWQDASAQIKTVVNKVVFPAIDLILAVFFFAKLGTAIENTECLSGRLPRFSSPAWCLRSQRRCTFGKFLACNSGKIVFENLYKKQALNLFRKE